MFIKIIKIICGMLLFYRYRIDAAIKTKIVKRSTMLRYFVPLLFGLYVHANQHDDLRELFSSSDNEINANCAGVKGKLHKGCYECYLCSDERFKYISDRKYSQLTLTDRSCKETKICCMSQLYLETRSGGSCGVKVPYGRRTGYQYQKRKSVRSVLEGEYPWRAWVYRRGETNKPLCAGAIVDDNAAYFMTSATCVHKYSARDLVVTFSRDLEDEMEVDSVELHEQYQHDKPSINDIALLSLAKYKQLTPKWVKSVCTPSYLYPPMHATPCIAMSDQDYSISTVIPLPKKCEVNNKALHVSQICASAPSGDYAPETGGGLFCGDELRSGNMDLFIYGIALEHHDYVTIYTNVSHFWKWINDKTSTSKHGYT